MLVLDHLAIGCRDLAAGLAFTEALLGVPMAQGGRHDRFGTHNRLLSLGPELYLEVIAPDPDGPQPQGPRWFGLDRFTGPPRLANWICAVPDLDAALAAAPVPAGEALALTRGDLRWRIGVPPDGTLPAGGGWPTLIEWGAGMRHPATALPDHGLRLLSLRVIHPEAERLGAAMAAQMEDTRVSFETGPAPALRAHILTPAGERIVS